MTLSLQSGFSDIPTNGADCGSVHAGRLENVFSQKSSKGIPETDGSLGNDFAVLRVEPGTVEEPLFMGFADKVL